MKFGKGLSRNSNSLYGWGHGYLKQQTEQGEILLDQTGAQVLSTGAVQLLSERDGMVMARTADGMPQLLRLDGTVLAASSGSISLLSQPGFYYAGSSGDYCLAGPTGGLAAGLEYCRARAVSRRTESSLS